MPSYYSTRSSYLSRSSPSTSLLNRTTSLDRNNYSSYSTNYGSSYGYSTPYASRPPIPSYTSSYYADTYKSKREEASPARSYRYSTDTTAGRNSSYGTDSKYSSSKLRERENSSSRDSGYSSRFSSRDRSVDIKRSSYLDSNHYGPSSSSYASNYLWDRKNKGRRSLEPDNDATDVEEKYSITNRNQRYLRNNDDSVSKSHVSEDVAARRKKDEEYISVRRQRLGLSPIRNSRSKTPEVHSIYKVNQSSNEVSSDIIGRSSKFELNNTSDSEYNSSKENEDEQNVARNRHLDSSYSESDNRQHTTGSAITNGIKISLNHLDDPSCSSINGASKSTDSSSVCRPQFEHTAGIRRNRVRDRIAARLAREFQDDDCSKSSEGSSFSQESGLVGLRNIGNTCFLNSVVQCLSNTRCLLEYLVKESYSSEINTSLSTMKGDLIRAFGNLIREMWVEGDSNRAINTGPFKTQIQKFAPTFSGYQQHDAQEFLRKLLEGLHEDVNRVSVRPRTILEDIQDDLSDDKKAMESWKRYLRFDDSRIVDMFVGQLKSSLKCSVCSHTSVTFDPFWDLSLPIPNKSQSVKLNQCLDLFTKEEIMDGDERPTCSKCKERRKMTKSFSIQKFPRILVLHLKRFSPTERWRGKLSCTVQFPIDNLDLSRYASSAHSTCSYTLNGVANHSGTTYSGHYTAFCKHPYSEQWNEYNDSRVSSIATRRICSPEAYVLFYELSSSGTSKL